ncbi:MAG: hypothetical protein IJ557_02385 [Bacteroidaceae bacterium]|nr:hypothetical protein [Bacteroidaceae bacterium]
MGYVNIATTTTLAKAIAKTNSNSDLVVFPNDQPHAIVRNGKVIGTTYTDGQSSIQHLPTAMTVALHVMSGVGVLTFDALPAEGVVHEAILYTPNFQEEQEIEIDPTAMPKGISNVYCNGSYLASGNYDYIYIPRDGFLWLRYVRFGTNLFIMTK